MRNGVPARKRTRRDKEYFFQDWVRDRLRDTGLHFDEGGRNSYPDLKLVHKAQGYEVKGLATPGRDRNYDCNSQVPTGRHNGRDVFYVFGRYPGDTDDLEVPITDLVIVHGDFLNANHEYVHKNGNVKGFGTYGDLMLRDRKMYVAPTPFALVDGVVGRRTLIVPAGHVVPENGYCAVGDLIRIETDRMLAGYEFDITDNTLTGKWVENPNKGKQHHFVAYRVGEDELAPVRLI